jgi:hypothetical protein
MQERPLLPPDCRGPSGTEITGGPWPTDGKVRGGELTGDDLVSA